MNGASARTINRTLVVHNRYAWRSHRTKAAPMANRAYSFSPSSSLPSEGILSPIDSQQLKNAVAVAIEEPLGKLDAIKLSPGFQRAAAASLSKAWSAGVKLQQQAEAAADEMAKARVASLASLEWDWICPVFVDTFRLFAGGVQMPRTHSPYAPEYRRQMVELVRSGDRLGPGEVLEHVKANQAHHRVATMCRVLGVSPSGYYAWRGRGRSPRAKRDEVLGGTIRAIHEASGGTYGAPRVHAELMAGGCRVSRKRVARLMREAGLAGVSRRRGTHTTRVEPGHRAVPDRVERQFQADAPDRLWVADVTYVPTWTGFVYLAIVLDVFSRRVVGWSMTHHLRTELVLGVLTRISHHPLGGWIIGCELECFFLSVAFAVEPGPVGGWS